MICLFRKGQLAGMNAQSSGWADVLEHKWFLCYIFNTPCSTHPFPLFTHLLLAMFFSASALFQSNVVNYLVWGSILICNYLFIFFYAFVFLNYFSNSHSIYFLFLFFCFDRDGAFVWFDRVFFFCCFLSEGQTCGWEHRGRFILDWLSVHVWVLGQCKCVVQRNKTILTAGSMSDFLFDCTPALSFLLSGLAHLFNLSISWWRHLGKPKWQLTSALIILKWPHKVAFSYEQFPLCICLFSYFLFPPRSFSLPVSA